MSPRPPDARARPMRVVCRRLGKVRPRCTTDRERSETVGQHGRSGGRCPRGGAERGSVPGRPARCRDCVRSCGQRARRGARRCARRRACSCGRRDGRRCGCRHVRSRGARKPWRTRNDPHAPIPGSRVVSGRWWWRSSSRGRPAQRSAHRLAVPFRVEPAIAAPGAACPPDIDSSNRCPRTSSSQKSGALSCASHRTNVESRPVPSGMGTTSYSDPTPAAARRPELCPPRMAGPRVRAPQHGRSSRGAMPDRLIPPVALEVTPPSSCSDVCLTGRPDVSCPSSSALAAAQDAVG